jgi:hypothetical protein
MAKTNRISSEDAPAYGARPAYSSDTADRVRAYLAHVEPRDAAADSSGYRDGMLLIERIAASANGEDSPALKLTANQCADVLEFINYSDPISRKDWWNDTGVTSHLVGLDIVLCTVTENLRASRRRS